MCFYQIADSLNDKIWGLGLLFFLLLTGILYTFRLKFIQFSLFSFIRSLIRCRKKSPSDNGLPLFRTMCMSLGTSMGTGNITGVASALAVGGAGAVFWMWVSAFFGMAVVYAENYLSALFSTDDARGPMAYIQNAMHCRLPAALFAVFCIFSSLGMGGMVQVSSFTDSLGKCGCFRPFVLYAVLFVTIFTVIIGGAERISSAAQFMLPLVTAAYTITCFSVLFMFRDRITDAFSMIISDAFAVKPVSGGICGFTVSRALNSGVRRGVFSNEAGLGSSPVLHSAAAEQSPHIQGMCSMCEVFFDTFICCTLTALVLLVSDSGNSVLNALSYIPCIPAPLFLTAALGIFAFCTIIGWYYCGETAFRFIFPNGNIRICALLFALFASLGAVVKLDTVWILSDIFNGLMAFPNLISLVLLIKFVKTE